MPDEAGVPPSPEEVADRMAIQDILHQHSRALDRLDLGLLQACYWPEAEVDYGSYKGPAGPFAELVLPALEGAYELTRHCLSNTLFSFTDGSARCESCVSAAHLVVGATQEMLFSGRYLDQLEKRAGRWKLLHRQVVIDWSRRHPVADERDSEAFAALANGAHGEQDPLYPFLQR